MQVDDVDCYGPSHIVMTNSREKIMSDIFSIDKEKNGSSPHLLIEILYILPCHTE